MQTPDEIARIEALLALRILDTAPEAIFDRLARLAARAFKAPIALVSLVDADRQWFKACVGLGVRETGRDVAFCDHAIRQDATLVVPDATLDPRFGDNPLVTGEPHIRFYAGAPLTLPSGERLGTLCVIDQAPRVDFGADDRALLEEMAASVVEAILMRRDISAFVDLQRERDRQRQFLLQAESLAGLGYWSLDLATNRTTWSPEVYRIHGLDPNSPSPDLEGAIAAYEPEDAAVLQHLVDRAMRTGEPFELQARIRRPHGEVRAVSAKGDCTFDDNGVATSLFGTFIDVTDLKLSDARIRRNEAHLRFLTENMTDVVMRIRPGEGITWISPSCRAFGYAPEEIIGTKANALIHPDDLADVEALRAARFAGEPDPPGYDRQFRMRRPDGGWMWVQGNPTIIRDAGGTPVEIVNVLRDVTDRREMEALLAASEARYRLLAENATDIIACYNGDGVFTFLSPAVTDILGYTPAELIGRTPMDIIHAEDVREVLWRFREREAAGPDAAPIRVEYRARHKDGSVVWLEAQPRAMYADDGKLAGFQDCVRDVTARKMAESALAESELRHSVIAEHATDIITRTDIQGRLRYASPSVTHVIGYTAAELVAETPRFLDRVHPDDLEAALAHVRRVMAGEAVEEGRIKYRVRRKDGAWIWLESNPTLVRGPNGEATEILDVLRDVSAQRQLESELLAARESAEAAAQVKTDFMANMSHEIRTPLTAILGFTRLLSARTDLDPKAAMLVARVAGAGQALMTIVNDVLDFSKLEAGQFEIKPRPASPGEALSDALFMFSPQADEKGLTLSCAVDGLPEMLDFDPDRVRQILLNLIGNAVKFTTAGSVRLVAGYDRQSERLHFAVEDTGQGLTTEQQAKLFLRFSQVDGSSTRQHGGTGLGLAISKGLTEAMGGTIGVRSTPGEGATFHVEISAPLVEYGNDEAEEQAPSLRGVRILVVDDNQANLDLLRAILASWGAEVVEAGNGPDALRAANEAPFHALLIDMRMPGMDGIEVVRNLRSGDGPNRNTPALAFTADVEIDGLYPQHGFAGHVRKPIAPAEMYRAIAAVLREDAQELVEGGLRCRA